MKIAIDIDEVLADSMPKMIEFHTAQTGEIIKNDDLYKIPYLGFMGKTEEMAIPVWLEFFDSKYSDDVKPTKDAKKSIELISKNHELFVITGRPHSTKQKTIDWLEKHFPNKFSGIYFDNKKTYKNGTEKHITKSQICMDLNATILIDDLLRFTNECHKNIQVLLFNKPWNQGELPTNVKRLNSWQEITNFVSNNE